MNSPPACQFPVPRFRNTCACSKRPASFATAAPAHAESTSSIPRAWPCSATIFPNFGIRHWRLSRRPPRKRTKRRNSMAPQTAVMATVKRTLRVGVPIEFAFRMLTEKMGTWWPASHHIGKVPFVEVVVEPRVGGKWMERGEHGEECQWGTVLVWDPPKQVVFSWQLQTDWTFSTDMSRASEVAFTFFADGPEATRMEFEHRHL